MAANSLGGSCRLPEETGRDVCVEGCYLRDGWGERRGCSAKSSGTEAKLLQSVGCWVSARSFGWSFDRRLPFRALKLGEEFWRSTRVRSVD